ncbi:MAG: hypothetical protein M3Q49_10780 [Actinomycetota bacterium]|nr:hypothetical protein [Actinomycetota bacterium]
MSKYLDLARGVSDGDRSPQPPVSGPEDTLCGISGLSGITPSVASMDSWDIRLAARDLGIKLSVSQDDELRCEPADRLTSELQQAIRDNRKAVLYDVLLADARRYLGERDVEGSDLSVLVDLEIEELDPARLRGDWLGYREAIRTYVRAGQAGIERARALDLPKASPSSARPMKKGVPA